MRPLSFSGFFPSSAISVLIGSAMVAAPAFSQPAPTNTTNMVTGKAVVLGTKTPLGDASITIPAGTVLTNYELLGEKVAIRQGPFAATIDQADLVLVTPAAATPAPSPTPSAAPTPAEQTPSPAPTAAAPETVTNEIANPPATKVAPAIVIPDWAVPAAVGALAAYALFTTLALFRPRRRPRKTPAATPAKTESDKTPVITLPAKLSAKPAMVADGGRAIACPLCGKNIPLNKVSKGRNCCSSCHETFVVE